MLAALLSLSLMLPSAGPNHTRPESVLASISTGAFLEKSHKVYRQALESAREGNFEKAQRGFNKVGIVSWQCESGRCPIDFERGSIKLKGLFAKEDNAERTIARVQSAFELKRAGEVNFRVGANTAFSLFVDGHEVFAHSKKRACRIDQEHIRLSLEAGVHQVALEFGNPFEAEFIVRLDDNKKALESDLSKVNVQTPFERPEVIFAQNIVDLSALRAKTPLEQSVANLEIIKRYALSKKLERKHLPPLFVALESTKVEDAQKTSALFSRAADAISDEALKRTFFEHARRLDPANPLARLGLGELLFSARSPKTQALALEELKRAQALAPQNLDVQRRAFALLSRHAHDRRLDHLLQKRALALNDAELAAMALERASTSTQRDALARVREKLKGHLSPRFSPGDAQSAQGYFAELVVSDVSAALRFAQRKRKTFAYAPWAYALEIEARRRLGEDSAELSAFVANAQERFSEDARFITIEGTP